MADRACFADSAIADSAKSKGLNFGVESSRNSEGSDRTPQKVLSVAEDATVRHYDFQNKGKQRSVAEIPKIKVA